MEDGKEMMEAKSPKANLYSSEQVQNFSQDSSSHSWA